MDKALYVICREELTKSQRIPQACHAVAELMGEFGQEDEVQDWLKNHRTLITLKATEEEMHELALKAGTNMHFIDDDFPPDFGWTAIAFWPMTRDEGRELFGHLRLA